MEPTNLSERNNLIYHEYDELREEIAQMLQQDNKTKAKINSVISRAGVMAESILLYVIKDSGREKQLNELAPNKRGLFEYRRIAGEALPEKQRIHIGTIIPWRNLANHSNDMNISDDELVAVNTAIKSLANWFFEVHLKDKFDPTKNQYAKAKLPPGPTEEEMKIINENFEKNPFNIPDYRILYQSKQEIRAKKKKRKANIRFLIIVLLVIGFFVYRKLTAIDTSLNGQWKVTCNIVSSTKNNYIGKATSYKMYFIQDHDIIKGDGEMWWIDNKLLDYKDHIRITMEGRVNGKNIDLKYTLYGSLRITDGEMHLIPSSEKNIFNGTFSGNAADAKGTVIAEPILIK